MEAEREVVDLMKARFMQTRLGEEFDGIVAGVASFGIFVELVELFVEGMVPVALLTDDYYDYHEKEHLLAGRRSGVRFRIGDPVRVRVGRVDLERRRIEFAPGGTGAGGAPEDQREWHSVRNSPLAGKGPRGSGGHHLPGSRGGRNAHRRRRRR